MKRITRKEFRQSGYVVVGEFGFGSPRTSGEIICDRENLAAVRLAYDSIREGDLGHGVLDDVIAAGGEHVQILY